MIRCYYLATTSSLSTELLGQLAVRLTATPAYGARIPVMNGKRMTSKPGELNDREYEGLMGR